MARNGIWQQQRRARPWRQRSDNFIGAIITPDQFLTGPSRGHSSFSVLSRAFFSVPGESGGGEGDAADKPRRRTRGSRGGRGRNKAKPAANAGPAGEGEKPKRTRGSRGGGRRRGKGAEQLSENVGSAEPHATSAGQIAAVPPEPDLPERTESNRAQANQAPLTAAEAPHANAQAGSPEQPAQAPMSPPGTAPFVPGPPRVGMRPAVIRPAPGRMSFSKGAMRHHFRPSGVKPARPFTPSVPGEVPPDAESQSAPPVEHTIEQDERALGNGGAEAGAATPPPPQQHRQQQPPPNRHHTPQHPHHRGPQPQQRYGGGRHDQRGGHQPHGRQGQHGQRHGPPQHHDQRRGPQNRGNQGGQPHRPMPGAPRHQELPHQPAPEPREPIQEPIDAAAEQHDLMPLPPANPAAAEEAIAPLGAELRREDASADASALAPFAEDIEIEEAPAPPPRRQAGRDMLINVVEGEEIRIALIRRGVLEELYMERSSTESHIGNIYKGKVTNVEPSIQAAFIDFGIGKNGFLHISDLHPQYFPKRHQPRMPQPRRTPPQRGPQSQPLPPNISQAESGAAAEMPPEHTPTPVSAHETQAELPAVEFEAPAESPNPTDAGMGGEPSPGLLATPMDNSADLRETLPEGMLDSSQAATEPQESAAAEQNGNANTEASAAESATETATDNPDGITLKAEQPSSESVENDNGEPEEIVRRPDDATLKGEEPDFGSAYNSEFMDDDEFLDEDGEEALDDGHMKPMEKVGRKTPRRERPPIQQCLRRGQEVIVQVTKEGIGTKGPTLTSYVSCPGRYLVMMPGMSQLGVSRKIEDLEQRRTLKRTLQELNPPRNLGFIIRTAGTEVAKKELQGDLNYLVRMWKVIANRIRTHKAPVELYEESDLVIRTIRDVFNDEVDRIIVDNEQVASRVRDFLSIVDPRSAGIVELYTGTMPLFQKFGVEREIEKINSRRVELPNGGSLVIDSTEALVAIDVNSGRYREQRDAEMTAFNMNKQAVMEVVRQLRLRDLGGVIVIDFIDMREERHKREIERLLQKALEDDRARTKVLRMSQFCMIEMTRQRVRPSLKRSIYMDCPHCHGSALIKTPESVSLDVMRRLAAGATRLDVSRLDVRAYPTVASFLLNRKRKALVELEDKSAKRISIVADESMAGDQIVIQPFDARGNLMNLLL